MKIQGPYIPHPAWPWFEELALPTAAEKLYARLAWKADEKDRQCTVKLSTMQGWLRRNERQVRTIVGILANAGLIVHRRGRYGDHFTVITDPSERQKIAGLARAAENCRSDPSPDRQETAGLVAENCRSGIRNSKNVAMSREGADTRARARQKHLKETHIRGGAGAPLSSSVPAENEHTEALMPPSLAGNQNPGTDHRSEVAIAEELPDLFPDFWLCFVRAGVALNESDKRRAEAMFHAETYATQDLIGRWVIEQLQTRWRTVEFTPNPVNCLRDRGWERIAMQRNLPRKQTEMEKICADVIARAQERERRRQR